MAEASISEDQDRFICPVCLHLPNDPVTVPCGHSFCMVCINGCWDQEDQRGVYKCPQCRETFTPRPVLRRNYFIAEMLEKLKKTEGQAASPAGPGDVKCDFCTGRKLKAVKSCVMCLASFCEDHLKPHYEVTGLKKHKLVKASNQLQEKICSQHDKLIEIYCRTDQSCICYLCTMHEHKGHDTVAAVAERTQKQSELNELQRGVQQRLQEKEKKLQELKEAVNTIKRSAQAALEDSEKIFIELIRSIEKKRSEVTELIRAQEEAELSQTNELLKNLEQDIADLKRRNTELEQLSQTEDHIHFLQGFQTLCVSAGSKKFPFAKCLSDLISNLEKIKKLTEQAAAFQNLPSEPKTRGQFLQYWHQLTLDPNTVYHSLGLSEDNRKVWWRRGLYRHSDHPERFDSTPQVLCKESLSGRCYWEVKCNGGELGVLISVSYKGIKRRGRGNECVFGYNDQSWSLWCPSSPSLQHNNVKTLISGQSPSKIGVYVDHSAGILSFYSVSDTMTLLHTVHTTFTQPLYAGFWVYLGSSVKLCEPGK